MEIRTPDPCLAKAMLYQLSYAPTVFNHNEAMIAFMVGYGRLELPTSRLSSVRSNQLS